MGKKKHKTPNKATKTTATIYLAVFRQIDGFITSYEIKISGFIKSYKKNNVFFWYANICSVTDPFFQ